MDRTWIVDGPWIAKNVKNVYMSSDLGIEDCGAYINCPSCGYRNDNRNVMTPWPGLPKGVKFEPTDEEVIEYLEAKCGVDGSNPNPFIQDFIFSMDDITYTHPQNLPVHKGCKKFMVLYKSAKKGLKPEKSKWVMHQYHLGREEEETGEYVVSKIMYQQQQGLLEDTTEASLGSHVIGQVAGQSVSKNDECSSFLVEKNPNYWDFNMGCENFMVSDLENADLGTLPNICSFASEDSLMNCLEWI